MPAQDGSSGTQFLRRLGLLDTAFLVIGAVIGSGIFMTPGLIAAGLPSPGLLMVVWLAGGMIALCGALSFAELGAMFPRAGGQYVYLREAYGSGAAFLFGWAFFGFIMCGGLAALAVAFAEFVGSFFPVLSTGHVLVRLNIMGLSYGAAAAPPDVPRHESKLPRLAVWHSWADTQAVGWIRLVLDREKVPYTYIRDEDIRAGRLGEKYDVILFGDNWLSLQDQIHGIDKKCGPLAYTKTKETPNLGVPDASADITGGIGWAGVARIEEFLAAGGVLVTLGNGSRLPLEGGLVRDVRRRGGAFFTPGSELKVKFVRPDHPWPTARPR